MQSGTFGSFLARSCAVTSIRTSRAGNGRAGLRVRRGLARRIRSGHARISYYCFQCEPFRELICKLRKVFCDERKGVANYFEVRGLDKISTATCGGGSRASLGGTVASHPSPKEGRRDGAATSEGDYGWATRPNSRFFAPHPRAEENARGPVRSE